MSEPKYIQPRVYQIRSLSERFMTPWCKPVVLNSIPEYVKEVSCTNNKYIETLPALPYDLRTLIVCNTNLRELPPLPSSLECLNVSYTKLTELPDPLPPTLQILILGDTEISKLPALPSTLRYLCLVKTKIDTLPPLPESLESLRICHTPITRIPNIPTSLRELWCEGTSIKQRPYTEQMKPYIDYIRNEESTKWRSMDRCRSIKQELYQTVYHPDAVRRLLTLYDWAGIEHLMD